MSESNVHSTLYLRNLVYITLDPTTSKHKKHNQTLLPYGRQANESKSKNKKKSFDINKGKKKILVEHLLNMEYFGVGREFNTYKEMLLAKERYEQATKTLLIIKNSGRFKSDDQRCEELVYNRLQYQCKAGTKRKSTSKGSRAVTSVKVDCPVTVNICVREGKLCVIQSMLEHENHTQDQETFFKYPENSRLTPSEMKLGKEMLAKGCSKTTVRDKLRENRDGRRLPKNFWSKITETKTLSNRKELNDTDCADESDGSDHCMSDIVTLTPKIEIIEETLDDDNHNFGDYDDADTDADDPLSRMFQTCSNSTDNGVNFQTKVKLKNHFNSWFSNLVPGEKLSYNEWLWQLDFNFPTIDKLNFIKYGIILGMTIVNKHFCDSKLQIDGDGIKEIREQVCIKKSSNLIQKRESPLNKEEVKQIEDQKCDIYFDKTLDTPIDAHSSDVEIDSREHTSIPHIESTRFSSIENDRVMHTEDTAIASTEQQRTEFEHLTTQTNQQTNCKMCPETFPTHSQLYNHMCKMHTSHIGVNCHICNKRFQYERNLNQHISTVHADHGNVSGYTPNDGRLICELCGAAFEKISSLRSHTRYVHSVEKFYCTYCNRKLSSKKALKQHIQFQHEQTFVTQNCDDCNRIFKYKSSYRMHMRKQHGISFS